ncbi:MAG TPA: hypothetical protein VLK33_00385 [Terriglobales bacterium]|nr:hypothetical protein [Terriglobales bacterium]
MKTANLLIFWRSSKLFLGLVVCIFFHFSTTAFAQDSRSTGWVVIPVDEYRKLHDKAYPVEPEREPPPVAATLTRVEYDLHAMGDVARGKVNLTVDVLKDGWVRVPVPSGLLVQEARLDGKLVSLVPSPEGKAGSQLAALLPHAGRFILSLDVVLPVSSGAGNESVSIPTAEAGATKASLQLSRNGVDTKVYGGLLLEKSESASDSKWVAYARGNEQLVFTWRRKTEDHHASLPLRLRGSLTQLVSLGEDSTSVYAEADVEIVQGVANEVKIQLPDKVTINQVSGAMVADWEMKDGALSVIFLEPVEHNTRFTLNGEVRLPREGLIDVPMLRLNGTERDTGGVAVEVLGAGEIKDIKSQGLEDADASDLGEMVASHQSPSLAAFRYKVTSVATSRSLSVNIARYTQQAVLLANIEEARYDVLMSDDGKVLTLARYAVRNNQRNFIKITLPAGATVWSASLGGKPAKPGQSPDGSLLLPLEKSRGGEDAPVFPVEILYVSKAPNWTDKGKVRLTLPALDLPVSRTGLLVYYPPLFQMNEEMGAFRTETYASPTSEAFVPPPPPPPQPVSSPAPVHGQGMQFANVQKKYDETQALLDKYRAKSSNGRVAGILPVGISFPTFGPSTFLVSELTAENQAPFADFTYQKDKKRGSR